MSRTGREFTMRNFRDTRTNVVRVSHNGRATVLRQHAKNSRLFGEKIKLSDIGTNVVPHSHECRAIIATYIFKIRPKFANLSNKCLFNETATNDWCIKLVSHWHANSSRLFREFSRGTFARHATVRVLHECRENFHVSRTGSEFTMRNFRDTRTNVMRVSHNGRATVLRQHAKNSRLFGEKIKLSDIGTNVVPHSHECLATIKRIKNLKMKIRYIRGKVVRHSHECRATVVRQSRDYREIYFQN